MAERELEVTINTTPPKSHPLTVSRIDSISTLVFDHKMKRKHRDAKKKPRATSTIDRFDGLNRAANNARATEAAPRYRASIVLLPPIYGSAVHHFSLRHAIRQFIAPFALWKQIISSQLKFSFGTTPRALDAGFTPARENLPRNKPPITPARGVCRLLGPVVDRRLSPPTRSPAFRHRRVDHSRSTRLRSALS